MVRALEVSEQRFIKTLLRQADSRVSAAVVLVGSRSRQADGPKSDIDIVTIGIDPPKPAPPRIQVIALSEVDLRHRLEDGDDFAQWALRLGSPLAGRAYWRRLRDELLSGASWPDHERKLRHAAVRLEYAEELASMGDTNASAEELRFALSHLARAHLLRRRVFPLSRAELPDQLREIGDQELAEAIELTEEATSIGSARLKSLLRSARKRLLQAS